MPEGVCRVCNQPTKNPAATLHKKCADKAPAKSTAPAAKCAPVATAPKTPIAPAEPVDEAAKAAAAAAKEAKERKAREVLQKELERIKAEEEYAAGITPAKKRRMAKEAMYMDNYHKNSYFGHKLGDVKRL
eukprot:NODE_9446_length_642_cov_11.204239_g9180_i0.p2 GENE.NODE_9446_length_642_cov_11.204239_g9180_i0~~NODE_9446_length_642_cov_11.204239_g9180_i0.p2  ORF type:complete len:131 (+),score=29.78 NODE_9446_length_642_cov_11.204239_g9180_i0:68-460(+)